jgi:sugar lactone lactonase YvrE
MSVNRVAGTFLGNGGRAADARLNEMSSLLVDRFGNIILADNAIGANGANHGGAAEVREVVAANGRMEALTAPISDDFITSIAGSPTEGLYFTTLSGELITIPAGTHSPQVVLKGLNQPGGLAIDGRGNLYISESGAGSIHRLVLATGHLELAAGASGPGYSGDGGPASQAKLSKPTGLTIDSAGNLFIADTGNNVIREVLSSTGVISTVAGNGMSGYAGDGGRADRGELSSPTGVAVDSAGDIFILDSGNDVIREVVAGSLTIWTAVGTGKSPLTADEFSRQGLTQSADQAELNSPSSLAVDGQGQLYVADSGNGLIRAVIFSK